MTRDLLPRLGCLILAHVCLMHIKGLRMRGRMKSTIDPEESVVVAENPRIRFPGTAHSRNSCL